MEGGKQDGCLSPDDNVTGSRVHREWMCRSNVYDFFAFGANLAKDKNQEYHDQMILRLTNMSERL